MRAPSVRAEATLVGCSTPLRAIRCRRSDIHAALAYSSIAHACYLAVEIDGELAHPASVTAAAAPAPRLRHTSAAEQPRAEHRLGVAAGAAARTRGESRHVVDVGQLRALAQREGCGLTECGGGVRAVENVALGSAEELEDVGAAKETVLQNDS